MARHALLLLAVVRYFSPRRSASHAAALDACRGHTHESPGESSARNLRRQCTVECLCRASRAQSQQCFHQRLSYPHFLQQRRHSTLHDEYMTDGMGEAHHIHDILLRQQQIQQVGIIQHDGAPDYGVHVPQGLRIFQVLALLHAENKPPLVGATWGAGASTAASPAFEQSPCNIARGLPDCAEACHPPGSQSGRHPAFLSIKHSPVCALHAGRELCRC